MITAGYEETGLGVGVQSNGGKKDSIIKKSKDKLRNVGNNSGNERTILNTPLP